MARDRSSEYLIPVPKDTRLTQTHTKSTLDMPEEVRPMLATYPDNSTRGKNWGERRDWVAYVFMTAFIERRTRICEGRERIRGVDKLEAGERVKGKRSGNYG